MITFPGLDTTAEDFLAGFAPLLDIRRDRPLGSDPTSRGKYSAWLFLDTLPRSDPQKKCAPLARFWMELACF